MPTLEATGRIRIVRVPAGEAPLDVREAWVGLELSCYPVCGYMLKDPIGVVTGQPVPHQFGVSVPQEDAIEILEAASPEAAAWWRAHGFPKEGHCFGFAKEEIEILSGVVMQRPPIVFDNMETGHMEPLPWSVPKDYPVR